MPVVNWSEPAQHHIQGLELRLASQEHEQHDSDRK